MSLSRHFPDLSHSCSDSLVYLIQIVIGLNNTTLAVGVVQLTLWHARPTLFKVNT